MTSLSFTSQNSSGLIGTLFLILFTLSAQAQWVQEGIDLDGDLTSIQYGRSVGISNDGLTIVVGEERNSSSAGRVKIFEYDGSTWSQKGSNIDGVAASNFFGTSVSISANGDVIAAGAPRNGDGGVDAGHARVFSWNGSSWIQRGSDIQGETAGDQSGESVVLNYDGDVIAIGAQLNSGGGASSGHVRVFFWNGSAWVQRGTDIDGNAGEEYGCTQCISIDSSGTTIAIGSTTADPVVLDEGLVRVYEWNGSAWVQKGADINGQAVDDIAGFVSINFGGNVLVIGDHSDGNGTDSGQIRVYEWNGSAWVQKGSDIDGEAAFNYFGTSLSISSDGNIVAAGAPNNGGTGANAGHVRLYEWNGSSWLQKGSDIDGESAGDQSGIGLDLSGDGQTVIIGAPFNDGNGSNTGHARVFNFGGTLPVELITFNAGRRDETVILSWSTATEKNNSHFEIERSTDLKSWETIGLVDGAGNSDMLKSYSYSDSEAPNASLYYRLKQIDFDGTFEYSKIVSVPEETSASSISIYPNPAGNILNITGLTNADHGICIFNSMNRDFTSSIRTLNKDGNGLKLDVSALKPGIYHIHCGGEVHKLVKQ
jgi:hypothetical protein